MLRLGFLSSLPHNIHPTPPPPYPPYPPGRAGESGSAITFFPPGSEAFQAEVASMLAEQAGPGSGSGAAGPGGPSASGRDSDNEEQMGEDGTTSGTTRRKVREPCTSTL